jgi:hypothetical protein
VTKGGKEDKMPTLDEILTRKILSTTSVCMTAENYIYWFNENVPPIGTHLRKGNEVVVVEKNGKMDLKSKINEKSDESLKRANGTLFFVRFTTYELTDAEYGWRY